MYIQYRGVAIGCLLNAVMAFLHMEIIEENRLISIMDRKYEWFHYVDDVLVIVEKNTNS